ncbi:MAG: hypothetical protein IPK16_11150 [Anaerolineales bacterium]|nr:hypothetical protein [Anaerolineales bacterium]
MSGNPRDDFDPYDANAVVSQGNVILTTWRTDPGRPVNGVFYSVAEVDAPESTVVLLPVPTPTPTPPRTRSQPTAASDILVLPATPAVAAPGELNPSQPLENPGNPGAPLVVGVAPAVVITAGFLLVAYVWRRRS